MVLSSSNVEEVIIASLSNNIDETTIVLSLVDAVEVVGVGIVVLVVDAVETVGRTMYTTKIRVVTVSLSTNHDGIM